MQDLYNKRFIIVGCSHSTNSGFDKNISKHYVNLLQKQTKQKIVNLSIGGMSHHEIFQRTIEFVTTNNVDTDDIVIVQWSSLHRFWAYNRENNVDDFTILNPSICGFGDLSVATKFSKLYTTYYCNDYMEIKHWFNYMIALQSVFKLKNVCYLFVNGFDNFLSDIDVYRYQEIVSLTETSLCNNLKNILDFDNRPDWYIIQKINAILKLYNQIDFTHCLKFGNFSFDQAKLDYADDGVHWGEQCNAIWADEILKHVIVQ